MNRTKKVLFVFVLIAVPFILGACGVPSAIVPGQTTTAGDFKKGTLVSTFPPTIPIYKGATVVESYSKGDTYGASFVVGDDLSKVVNFYNTLPQLGWDSTPRQVSAANYTYDIKGGTIAGTIIVNTAADGKATAISIFVANR